MTDDELIDEYCMSLFGHILAPEDDRESVRCTIGFKQHGLNVRANEFWQGPLKEIKKLLFWR